VVVPRRELDRPHHVNEIPTAPFTVIQGARMLVSALVTFLVVILILYLINMLPLDGRAKQICRVVVIVLGVISLLRLLSVF
jgi:Na+/melibiose symporter-like transporter